MSGRKTAGRLAEVTELVNIPSHIRFWGLDSGIRHRHNICLISSLTFREGSKCCTKQISALEESWRRPAAARAGVGAQCQLAWLRAAVPTADAITCWQRILPSPGSWP